MRIAVTGGSGFIASHLILQLLQRGYPVRTTLRSIAREPSLPRMSEEWLLSHQSEFNRDHNGR